MKRTAFLAVLCGGIGFFLRRVQLQTGFAPDTGLALPGNLAAALLIFFSAAVALCALLLAYFSGSMASAPRFPYQKPTAVSAAILLGASGIFGLVQHGGIGATVLAVFSLLTALCLLLLQFSGERLLLLAIEPPCFFAAWTVLFYAAHASNPVLLSYYPALLALCAATLAAYYAATRAIGNSKQRSIFFSAAAIFFMLVSCADAVAAADGAALCAFLSAAVLTLSYLLAPMPAGRRAV